jgi:hypothetical protein
MEVRTHGARHSGATTRGFPTALARVVQPNTRSLGFPRVRRGVPQSQSTARIPAETTWGRGMAEAAEGRIALTVGSAAMPPNPFAALASMVG